jgi:type III pantothenate kinase
MALFQNGRIVRWVKVPEPSLAEVRALVDDTEGQAIAVASVGMPAQRVVDDLGGLAPVHVITGATRVPIGNAYDTPHTLGVDRIANAVGAVKRHPGRPLLVIDAGTCITYDVVDADGVFQGGAISPGLAMRAKAMHEHSARLPLVTLGTGPSLVARSTEDALRSGILHGTRHELRGFIDQLAYRSPDLTVLLTGGDGVWAARALKYGIFAVPFLTLEGLHAILHHQLELGTPPAVPAHGSGSAG